MNSEIIYRLEQTFLAVEHAEALADPSVSRVVEELLEEMEKRGIVWNPPERGRRAKT